MDRKWVLQFRSYLFECFFDENNNPWDERLVPKSLEVEKVDATAGTVVAKIVFESFTVQTAVGGF